MAFSAHEVAASAGISKNTLLRWLKQGKVPEVCRDRNGWRVFAQDDVDRIRAYADTTVPPASCAGSPDAGYEAPPPNDDRSSAGSEAA